MKNHTDDFPYNSGPGTRDVYKRSCISEAQNHRCAYCGIRTVIGNNKNDPLHPDRDRSATVDEYQPRSQGGKRRWSNQVLACWLCNTGRSSTSARVYFEVVKRVGRVEAFIWGCVQNARPERRHRTEQDMRASKFVQAIIKRDKERA